MSPAGVDPATLAAYDTAAAGFAQDWHGQPAGTDLQETVRRYFKPGGITADIGCGAGREVAWLSANGFPCVGFDASEGLLAQARQRYPDLKFIASTLPEFPGVSVASFDNVLCETVIMHLPPQAMAASVRRMVVILKSKGMLYLTWRVTKGVDQRDSHGRLYAAFDAQGVRNALAGADILLDEEILSASSGKTIHRIVARRQ